MKTLPAPTASDSTPTRPVPVNQRIPLPGGAALGVRFYGRRPAHGKAPLVLHFHGGAFAGGSLDTGACVAQVLADAGAVVMSLDYPLAPDQVFPAAVEAGHAALLWAHKARSRLAGPGAQLFVAGEEAGGNIAAAVALMARDRQGPALAGQILLSPMLDPCVATASLRDAQAGPVGCIWADGWQKYLGAMDNASHPYATPGQALRLAGLPATLMVTAGDDPMRDDALAYTARLRGAGLVADDVVLAEPTGWPCSFLKKLSPAAAWVPSLRKALADFLSRGRPGLPASSSFSSSSSSAPTSAS